MGTITAHLRRFRRGYNDETVGAILEARAHARGEIELEEGYIPPRIVLREGIPSDGHWKVRQTQGFETDIRRLIGSGADLYELEDVVNILANGGILPRRYRDRQLGGDRRETRKCRIGPDMILTYSIDGERLTLMEVRMKTRSGLFRSET